MRHRSLMRMLCNPARSPFRVSNRFPGGTFSSSSEVTESIWTSLRTATLVAVDVGTSGARAAAFGLDGARLAWRQPGRHPIPQPSWTVAGEVRPALARRFGLPRAVPVIAGVADSLACALGASVTGPGSTGRRQPCALVWQHAASGAPVARGREMALARK